MLRLVATRGRRAPAAQELVEFPVRIGCAPGNDVVLHPEGGAIVMPHHAEIRREGGALWLVDLGTPAGTFVGGARVARHALRSGDEVSFGAPRGPALRVELSDPAAAAPESARVDLETAQRLVHAAVRDALGREDKAVGIAQAKAAQATRRAARHNLLLGLGVAAALVAVVVAAVATYRSQRAAARLAEELGLDHAPVAAPAGTIPTRVLTGREILEQNKAAVYVMGFLLGDRIGGCCSAFAIGPSVLATNAHCVSACRARGGTPIVTQNESGGRTRFNILKMTIHPEYKTGSRSADSPDVGLLRVDGRLPVVVTLASDAELRAIGPGDDAFVIGFPGRVMDPLSPAATFLQGRVGRVMGLGEEAAPPDRAVLIQHDAPTRGGASGSPIFNQHGHVIGVHAAHIDEEADVQIAGQKTKVVQSSAFRLGMRADLLKGVPAP